MQRQRRRPSYLVAWARDGVNGWKAARKHAIKLRRDGVSVPEICRLMLVPRQWVHKWWNRWITGGKKWASLEDRPSRPQHIRTRRHEWTDKVLELRKRFPYGAQKLKHVGKIPLSHTTINRILQDHGANKRIKQKPRKFRRFCRPFANYLWQIDTCQIATEDGWVYIQSVLDDHSRFVLASRATSWFPDQGETIRLVKRAVALFGPPLQILTDNGNEFHSTQRDEPGLFTQYLLGLGIRHIRGRPKHPRTQGKIERWHRSLKYEWLYPESKIADQAHVQRLLGSWLEFYNHERPHAAIKLRTPGETYLGSLIMGPGLSRLVNGVP